MTRKVSERLKMVLALCSIILSSPSAQAALSISDKATSKVVCRNGTCSAKAPKAILNVTDLANMLAAGNVNVVSGNQAADISVDAALTWTSTSRLTLDAYHSLAVNKLITVAGTGNLTITTNDGGSGGDYVFLGKGHIEFWDLSSELIINGQFYYLAKGIKKFGHLFSHGGYVALSRSYNAAKDGTYSHALVPDAEVHFEGLGNVISNLSIQDDTQSDLVGLFREVIPRSSIRDIGLTEVHIVGGNNQSIGALAAQTGGVILHCYVTGQVSGGANSSVGGIAGGNFGSIVNSHSEATVSGGDGSTTGGLAGFNDRSIDQSYAGGGVTTSDNAMAGGLVGWNDAETESPQITNSYAMGAVTGGANASVGGIEGSVTGFDPVTWRSYSTGLVTGGSGATLGGLIGSDTSSSGNIFDAYWDLDTSGISNPHQGAGNVPDDPGITGLSDAQLKSGLPAGFDPTVWAQKPKINNGYPYLLANPPPK